MKLKQSSHRPFICLVIATVLQSSSAVHCTEGEIQLVGGGNSFEGLVEVCDTGEWKTVCDRGWFEEEAKVVCTQLNYSDPSSATYVRRGCAGQGFEGQDIVKKIWRCSGEESNLRSCIIEETECNHRRDAGVYCSGKTPDDCEEDTLRLVDGPNDASGRVEVCRFGCWGTVCDKGWDRNSSTVACRELGFETEQAIPTMGGYFSNVSSSRPIHVSRTDCGKDNTKLTSCSEFKVNKCTHSQDAGVICHGTSTCLDGDVRLVGEESEWEGRVEMCYNGVWGAVCADGWGDTAAEVVCSQLGYTNSRDTFTEFGWEKSPVIFNNIACNEAHSMLVQCVNEQSIGVHNCGENNIAGVICEMPSPDNLTISTSTITDRMSSAVLNTQSDSVSQITTDMTTSAVSKSQSIVWPTNTDLDMTTVSTVSNSQSVVLSAVGGLLAAGAIIVISVASVVITVVIKKQKRITFEKGSAMDNPTYDECRRTATLNSLTLNDEYEKEFENPIYSDELIETGHNSTSKTNSQLQNTPYYEGVYFESTTVNETFNESADNDVIQGPGAHINGASSHVANDGAIMKGATSEGVYHQHELQPTYSQLQPYLGVPKPGVEINCPLNDDDYSHLKHK